LIERFWPDCSPARGANNLSIAIYQIRGALKVLLGGARQVISVQHGLYGLDMELGAWIDVEQFRAHVDAGWCAVRRRDNESARSNFLAALELYGGDLLESDPYEEWTIESHRYFGDHYGRALCWLADDAAESQDWPRVAEYAKCVISRDGCDEEGQRWLMTAYWRLGNRAEALQQYRRCATQLRAEFGVGPSLETKELLGQILGRS